MSANPPSQPPAATACPYLHIRVTGRVQGVGYRYATQQQARQLKLGGWVQNRLDGSVEAHFCGSAEAIAAIAAWCRHGPPGAAVEQITTHFSDSAPTEPPLPPTFEIRY